MISNNIYIYIYKKWKLMKPMKARHVMESTAIKHCINIFK